MDLALINKVAIRDIKDFIALLIYQTISTPDGLIFHLHGPLEGRRHNLTLLRESRLPDELPEKLKIDGLQHYIYGDKAHILWARL